MNEPNPIQAGHFPNTPTPEAVCAYCGAFANQAGPCEKNPRNRPDADERMIDIDEMVINPGLPPHLAPNDRTVSLAKRLLRAWPEASASIGTGGTIALCEGEFDDSTGRTWVHLVIVGVEEDVDAREEKPA